MSTAVKDSKRIDAFKKLDKAIGDLNDLLDAPRLDQIGVQLAMPLA